VQGDVAAASEEGPQPHSEGDSADERGNLPRRPAGMPPPHKLEFGRELGTGFQLSYSHYRSPAFAMTCDSASGFW
jgi:hypothetical protein